MDGSPRRGLGRAIAILNIAFGVSISLYLIPVSLSAPAWWTSAPPWVRAVSLSLAAITCGLVVAFLALLVRDLLRGETGRYVLSRSEEGTARISLRAIQASLLRRAREVPEVAGAKVTVRRPRRQQLRVEISFATAEDRDAIAVSEALKRALRERLADLVHPDGGMEAVFDVRVESLVASGAKAAETAPAEKPGEPFTGPRYPVD